MYMCYILEYIHNTSLKQVDIALNTPKASTLRRANHCALGVDRAIH